MIGKDITKNSNIFHVLYSVISFLEIKDSKNKNIKNVRNGRKIIIPIIGNKLKPPKAGN